jgi:hypothetical protein
MSLIGSNHLSDIIIINKNITSPDLILTELNKRIIKSLKQEEIVSEDGMDINISVIFDGKIQFASAYNPLIYLDQNDELQKIGGDHVSLGSSRHKEDLVFKLHEIPCSEVKTMYQYSDGIVDQFGGPKGKKFMLKRVRQLMLDAKDLSVADQKNPILDGFEEWMKDEEQVDDVLLIGYAPNS